MSNGRTFLVKSGSFINHRIIIMSFRWSLSRDVSDRSYYAQGNELIATSIGITGNRSALSCRLNVDQKDYKYCKTEEEILETFTLVEKKLKRWAFREIQKSTHYHREVSSSIFVPEALSNGDYGVLSKFLGNLRNNRVNSYIKLNIQESYGYFHKAATLLKPAARMVKERMQFAFIRLRVHMSARRQEQKNKILIDIDRYSSIENENSLCSEPSQPKKDVINVSYISVKVNPQKINEINRLKTHRQSSSIKKDRDRLRYANCVDLNELIGERRVRQYQFKHVNHVSDPRMNSERIVRSKDI